MKIAVFIKSTTFNKSYGGLETQNKLLCEGLVSRGHSVTVFTPKYESGPEELKESGVTYKFVHCKVASFSSVTVSKKDSWAEKSFEEFLSSYSKEKYDLIIGQSSGAVGVIRHRDEFEVPIISIAHGTKIGEMETKLRSDTSLKGLAKSILEVPHVLKNFFTVQRQFVHGSNVIVAVSNSVKRALVDETFVEENKVRVINNGIETPVEKAAASNAEKGKIRLLYVGQLIKSKGIEKLAQAIVDGRFEGVSLDIVGAGELEGELRVCAEKSGGKIKLHGKLPHDEVIKMYNPSLFDLFVFPTSRIEGFPMVLIEAMFGGLPVLAFNLGGVSDAVFDGETGLLVKAGDFGAFTKKMLELRDSSEEIKKMGEAARNKAMERFSLNKMLDSYEEIFKELHA